MAIKTFKPVTPGLRHRTASTYNEVTKMYCKSWVIETIKEIESLTQYDTWEAKEVNKGTSFYCTNICSVCNKCQALKEYQMKYKG